MEEEMEGGRRRLTLRSFPERFKAKYITERGGHSCQIAESLLHTTRQVDAYWENILLDLQGLKGSIS